MDMPTDGQCLTFGPFCIDFAKRGLFRINESGKPVRVVLGSRAFDILVLLVSRAGELVDKTVIMNAVWPGVAVEEANLTVQMSALRRAFGPQGLGYIQTVPRRGYRFAADVAPSIAVPREASVVLPANQPLLSWLHWRICLAVLVVLIVGAGSAGVFRHQPSPRMSVAVLPFSTGSEATSVTDFAAQLSETLTLDLTQLWAIQVTAPEAAARLGHRNSDAGHTDDALRVRYLVEGSLRAIDDRITVHVDLVSGETGKELWTGQTEWPSSDATAAQPLAGAWLQNSVGNAVLDLEATRSKREHSHDPDATDLYLQGRALLSLPATRDRLRTARGLLERAVQTGPDSYLAITGLVTAIISNETDLNDGVTEQDLKRAEHLVAEAEAIAPTAYSVQQARGYLLRLEHRWPEAEAAFEKLLSLYPHAYYASFQLGICHLYTGRASEAITLFENAVATSGGRGDLFSRYIRLGEALVLSGRYEEAIPWLRKAEIADPGRTPSSRAQAYLLAGSALALAGHIDAARDEVAQGFVIFPYVSVRSFWGMRTGTDLYEVQIDRVRQGLALAGLQDHVAEDATSALQPPVDLPAQIAGSTPAEVEGARVISTAAAGRLLDDPGVVVLDGEAGLQSIPGAVSLPWISRGGSVDDDMQLAFDRLLVQLTAGDKGRSIVTLGGNAYSWPSYNLARRAVALGYRNVFWFRGGRDTWAASGRPMERPRADPLMAPEGLL
jgi:DNA-binding winged helix-turn-helix (wHTH) protein/TolB-like protein